MQNFELKWARENAGLTQAQAAAKIGVARLTFTRWETGATPIPRVKWLKFLAAVELAPTDIPLGLEDAEPPVCLEVDPSEIEYDEHYRAAYWAAKEAHDAEKAAWPIRDAHRTRYHFDIAVPAQEAYFLKHNNYLSHANAWRDFKPIPDATSGPRYARWRALADLHYRMGLPELRPVGTREDFPPPPWLSDVSDLV